MTSTLNQNPALVRMEGNEPGDRLPPICELSQVLKAGRNLVRDALLEVQSLGPVKIGHRQVVFVDSVEVGGGTGCNTLSAFQEMRIR